MSEDIIVDGQLTPSACLTQCIHMDACLMTLESLEGDQSQYSLGHIAGLLGCNEYCDCFEASNETAVHFTCQRLIDMMQRICGTNAIELLDPPFAVWLHSLGFKVGR